MPMPSSVSTSLLYKKLSTDSELLNAIESLRNKSEALAATIIRDASMFTDHTVRHMDALWLVTEKILTQTEIDGLSAAEAFLLAAGFYFHDIGMSYAATADGLMFLEKTSDYASVLSQASVDADIRVVRANALAYAIRVHHAHIAEEMAVKPIPGTSDYLLEPKTIREQFGSHCGKIAASHHWSVERVEAELGAKGIAPLAGNRSADLGFVAGTLRLIDYAHINRERALPFERSLRAPLGAESAIHWDAQQNIDGPQRNNQTNELVYVSSGPVCNVEAWWLFYEFARGLNKEINQVMRFLQSRTVSACRLSLVGVQGTSAPEDFEKLVKTDGFLPLEVNVKANSIDRLVRLLAGESLYGKNLFAPVRELIQNALDAILLKKVTAINDADKALCKLAIKVKLKNDSTGATLSVSDWGVGMTKKILTEHLLTIASDYWEAQFHVDFPKASENFSPAGKFGIGFLSVFMLGRKIEVSSQRTGNDRYHLTIHGLGKRAELRQILSNGSSGSTVAIQLSPEAADQLLQLPEKLPTLIPMLDVAVELDTNGIVQTIAPKWVLQLDDFALKMWVRESSSLLFKNSTTPMRRGRDEYFYIGSRFRESREYTPALELKEWPTGTPEYCEDGVRLLADSSGQSILCLRGFALEVIHTPGFTGVIDSDSTTPDAARRSSVDFDQRPFLRRAISHTRAAISKNLSERRSHGFIPDQIEFVSWCVSVYGHEVLKDSAFPWVQIVISSGDSRYVSSSELAAMLVDVDSIYLGMNIGPISVSKRWRLQTQMPSRRELGICFSDASPGYISEQKNGKLDHLWPAFDKNALFSMFLNAVSDSWCTSIPELLINTEIAHKSNELCGFLSRPVPAVA
jgi:Histidine kinase-, DNA gyrase B-, and HSP90-like ATPase